jgi:hypothetical protein
MIRLNGRGNLIIICFAEKFGVDVDIHRDTEIEGPVKPVFQG